MLPTVALVGRPNVGKSTLFNQLTGSRDALVADQPGVTRDRRYGFGAASGRRYLVVDTGGVGGAASEAIEAGIGRQVDLAVDEADCVLLVCDYRDGITAGDERVAERLRRSGKHVIVAVNKSEGVAAEIAAAEFHGLGLGAPVAIAALHGRGLGELIDAALAPFAADAAAEPALEGPRIALLGRPNVGKSTLINRLVGAERMITSPEPGTTRDSVLIPCDRDGRRFVLIDTAGVRRRAKVVDAVEKFSVVQTLQAIEASAVVIVLIDAREGLTDQDLHLIGLVVERGRGLVVGVNKWDGLSSAERGRVRAQVDRQLDFVPWASVHTLSALHGSGLTEVVSSALAAHESAGRELPTARLNELLERAVAEHAPPLVRGRQVRLRYAHQGGRHPPLIVIHGSQAERLPAHYRRYLENAFREMLGFEGTPVRIELKTTSNPFAGRRNVLTPRQRKRRQRVIRHRR